MNIELTSCPLCNSGQFNLYLTTTDFSTTNEDFKIEECNSCTFRFTNPRPEEAKIGDYYESQDYISHTDESSNLVNKIYKIARYYTIRDKSKLVGKWSRKGKLLDLGCGTGEFLSYNKLAGWETSGVEVSARARMLAEAKLNHKVLPDIERILPENKFDAITLWHVLEHVYDLDYTCKKLVSLLDENGTIFLAVPNCESYDAEYYKEHWAAYDVPRHLYHFTKTTMARLWQKYNMKIEAVVPMKLDSFYVSLLSEKYKTGASNFLKASKVGMLSNLKAQKENNYSSLIYIIRN